MINRRALLSGIASAVPAIAAPHVARAQQVKHYRFAYDQPKPTGYGILGDIFANKLKELSKGTMLIDQYPGAQLGQGSRRCCSSLNQAISNSASRLRRMPRPCRPRPV